ncbi:hypothetical protein [Soonwooa purpurea]
MSKKSNLKSSYILFLLKKIDKLGMRVKSLENEQKKGMLSILETKQKYGISRSTIDRYRKKGLKVGQPTRNGQIYIDEIELQDFLKNKMKW